MNSTKAVIIYGPQGSGKTLHAEALRKLFGKAQVIEAEEHPHCERARCKRPFPDDALVMTNNWATACTQRTWHRAHIVDIGAALAALDAQAK